MGCRFPTLKLRPCKDLELVYLSFGQYFLFDCLQQILWRVERLYSGLWYHRVFFAGYTVMWYVLFGDLGEDLFGRMVSVAVWWISDVLSVSAVLDYFEGCCVSELSIWSWKAEVYFQGDSEWKHIFVAVKGTFCIFAKYFCSKVTVVITY